VGAEEIDADEETAIEDEIERGAVNDITDDRAEVEGDDEKVDDKETAKDDGKGVDEDDLTAEGVALVTDEANGKDELRTGAVVLEGPNKLELELEIDGAELETDEDPDEPGTANTLTLHDPPHLLSSPPHLDEHSESGTR